jgi:hypothetical protein
MGGQQSRPGSFASYASLKATESKQSHNQCRIERIFFKFVFHCVEEVPKYLSSLIALIFSLLQNRKSPAREAKKRELSSDTHGKREELNTCVIRQASGLCIRISIQRQAHGYVQNVCLCAGERLKRRGCITKVQALEW